MDFLTPSIEIFKLLEPLTRQINYIKNSDNFLKDMKEKRDTLVGLEEDTSKEIVRAELQRKDPKNEVMDWLKRVENAKNEVDKIEKEFVEKKRCFKGCLPNYCSYRKVSKTSLELISKISDLLQQGKSYEGHIFVDQLPATVHTMPTTHLLGEETAELNKKLILECIMDEKIGKIGVYGIGGVGKTKVMEDVNNYLKDAKRFQSIIWVTVSKDCSLQKLQGDIASKIELILLDDHDVRSRATQIFEALLTRKKFVIILDDMWEAFSLKDIGIPEPSKVNGCKIVLTTRSEVVCSGMETDKNIRVRVLLDKEAWALFSSKVGDNVVLSADIQEVAKDVARECGGLPLALITVGHALRGVDDVRVWKNALNELIGSTHKIRGMHDEVFKHLKFSYDRLSEDDNIQACFLYCSLYPEDYKIPIKELIEFWIWEGLINEVENEEIQWNKAYHILNELKSACMLESVSNDDDFVKMHDLIRDMAISITRDSPRFLVKAGIRLIEQLKDEEWIEDVERISLGWNYFAELSGQPNCPRLSTLFLQKNYNLNRISSYFFHYMHELRVLNISSTWIESLPQSLSELVNLRALLLNDTKLVDVSSLPKLKELRMLDLSDTLIRSLPESLSDFVNLHSLLLSSCHKLVDVPSLANLKKLKILNLEWTDVEELPAGMEGLTNLRELGLSGTRNLKRVRAGVIPKLSLLERFSIYSSSWKWDMKNTEGVSRIDEIIGLQRLHEVALNFKDLSTFSVYVRSARWRTLKDFHFSIGDAQGFFFRKPLQVEIRGYDLGNGKCSLLLPHNTAHLAIGECSGIVVLSQMLLEARDLECCEIKSCDDMECVFADGENSWLSTVKELSLFCVHNLRAISKVVMPYGAFASLKRLEIIYCYKLRNVFSLGLVQSLQNLEDIDVQNCEQMEEIIEGKGEHCGVVPSLKKLVIINCPKLKALFSSELLQSLQNLQEISVSSCEEMEKLVVEEGEEEEISEVNNCITRNAISLPRLKDLVLYNLPKVKCICKRELICNSLQTISIVDCHQLRNLPLSMENLTSKITGTISGSREWWDALEWNNPMSKTTLQHLFREVKQKEATMAEIS